MPHRTVILAGLLLCAAGALPGNARAADPGAVLDDSVITAKIKADLLQDPDTKAHEIKVKTDHGVVQLSGFVDSEAQITRAGEIASTVDGVKDVSNRLTLRVGQNTPGQMLDNSILTTKVRAALIKNPDTKAREIKVTSQGDIVMLSGFVDSYAAKEQAYKVASEVDGVHDVRNDLQVRSP